MSKRIRLSLSAQEKQSTDWSKCFICQEDKHEALKSPPMKIDLAKSGYRTLSKNISEFAKINEMPIPLDIRRIDEGDGIEAAFIKNEAKYHESCRLMFNNTKLQRVQKRHQPPDTSLSDIPLSFKFTRKSSTAPTEERSFILKNVSSVRNKHRVLNSVKL